MNKWKDELINESMTQKKEEWIKGRMKDWMKG